MCFHHSFAKYNYVKIPHRGGKVLEGENLLKTGVFPSGVFTVCTFNLTNLRDNGNLLREAFGWKIASGVGGDQKQSKKSCKKKTPIGLLPPSGQTVNYCQLLTTKRCTKMLQMGGKLFCKGKAQLYRMWYFLFSSFLRERVTDLKENHLLSPSAPPLMTL